MSAFLDSRGIEYRRIPFDVVRKAEKIIRQIEGGEYWGNLGGHRLLCDRTIVAVPVGRKWRLVGRANGDGVMFTKLLSHEAYNGHI